jgi:hypothetical protein
VFFERRKRKTNGLRLGSAVVLGGRRDRHRRNDLVREAKPERPTTLKGRCLMVSAFEIMPVLALAMMIVLIPLLGDPP